MRWIVFLRVFDGEGNILRNAFGGAIQNDNRPGSTDSLLTFTAPTTGTYYVGVSGAGNQAYDPTVAVGATPGSMGNYNLTIDVTRKLNPIQDGNRLQLDGAQCDCPDRFAYLAPRCLGLNWNFCTDHS